MNEAEVKWFLTEGETGTRIGGDPERRMGALGQGACIRSQWRSPGGYSPGGNSRLPKAIGSAMAGEPSSVGDVLDKIEELAKKEGEVCLGHLVEALGTGATGPFCSFPR